MCGRRLLEPRRADGSTHYTGPEADRIKGPSLKAFPWAAVKNYNVDILIEHSASSMVGCSEWDEEVEIYDIRGMCFSC